MRRIRSKNLLDWLHSDNRKPLILRGARQVGKSTLVRLFAKEQGLRLHEINLEKKKNWASIFDTNDVKKILQEVEDYLDVSIDCSPGTRDLVFLMNVKRPRHCSECFDTFLKRFVTCPLLLRAPY